MESRASEILDVKPDCVKPFEVHDSFNDNVLSGVICRQSDHRYGALVIFKVNDWECEQVIWGTPKLEYPFDRNGTFHWPPIHRVEMWDKLDGCLHWKTEILTDHGKITIGNIVNKKLPVKVLSFSEKTNEVSYKNILSYHKEPICRQYLRIVTTGLGKQPSNKGIVCTNNHKFYSNGTWVEAKDLKIKQKVSHVSLDIEDRAKEMLLGCLLGDSSIARTPHRKTRFVLFGHSIAQSEYFEYKKMLLSNLFHEGKGFRGGFSGSKPNRRGFSLTNDGVHKLITTVCEEAGKKKITERWIDKITPLSLAFWYMDDGSMGSEKLQRARASLHTHGYTEEEVNLLRSMLKKNFNIDSSIYYSKGFFITLTADGSEKFFKLIYPYICDSMKYKLPKKYQGNECILCDPFLLCNNIDDVEVLEVSSDLGSLGGKTKGKFQYDITVDDNSNYFARGVLVHNTNILAYTYNYKDSTFLTYKTRLTPVLAESTYGSFLSMWIEMLSEHEWIHHVIDNNPDYNLSFELYGSRNPITIQYDTLLDTRILFGIHKKDHAVKPPTELWFAENAPECVSHTPDMDLTDLYNAMRENMSDKNAGGLYCEGLVMYANTGGGSWRMFKCKPEEIERIHWAASGTIPKRDLWNTALNAFEGEEPSIEVFIELLSEEYTQELINRSRIKIGKIFMDATIHMQTVKSVNEVWRKAKEEGFDVMHDKAGTLRWMSQFFPKSQMRKVGSIILKQAGVLS